MRHLACDMPRHKEARRKTGDVCRIGRWDLEVGAVRKDKARRYNKGQPGKKMNLEEVG